jgi:hypothetical protein
MQAWAAGGSINTGRRWLLAGAGTQTAGLASGGSTPKLNNCNSSYRRI